ncbi:MAG: methyltransferase domain-containing protein [Terriglobales bacterium]
MTSPTLFHLMESRYKHLLRGAMDRCDDPGLYLLVPKVATWLHLSIAHAYDLTIGVLILAAALIGACAIRKGTLGSAVFFCLAVIMTTHVADVYAFQALPALAGIPWLLRLRDDPNRLAWFAIAVAAFAGLCDLFRSHAGLPYLAMIAVLVFSRMPKIKAAALCVLLAVLYLAPVAYMRRLYPNFHPFWHSVYIGLGWVHNSEVARYRDEIGFAKGKSIDPSAAPCSPRYEAALCNEVIRIAEHKPWIIAENLLAKLAFVGVAFGLILLPVRRWNLAFAVAIALGALPAILVTPNPAYILGALCCACLYAGATLSAQGTECTRNGSSLGTASAVARNADSEENLWGYAKRLRFVHQRILDAFPGKDPRALRVLDVGCGNGSQLALPLAECGYQVTGMDPDPASVERAAELAKGRPNAEFLCMRLDGLAPEACFDVVILSEVLEHVHEPARLLAEGAAHLTEDGIVMVTVPNGYGEFEIDGWIFRTWGLHRLVDGLKSVVRNGRGARIDHPEIAATENHACGHVQFFTYRRLRKMFDECELQVFREGRGSFLCGPMVCHSLARSRKFIEWNSRITERLPMRLASAWYFALRRTARIP